MDIEKIKKIEKYSKNYSQKHIVEDWDPKLMLDDWWEGLKFFMIKSFYQGRPDILSNRVSDKIMGILNEMVAEENDSKILLDTKKFSEIQKRIENYWGKGFGIRKRDIKMVIGTLSFVANLSEKNIIRYSISKIKSGNIQSHFRELQGKYSGIHSVGQKIASFYLRDLVFIYNLERSIPIDDLELVMPIDTHVRQVTQKVGIINNIDEDDSVISKNIVQICNKLKISPIKFNQGAWYVDFNNLFNKL